MAEAGEGPTGAPPVPLRQRVVGSLALLLALAAVGIGVAGIALLYPIFHDDQQLDQAVLAVALDWRDFGRRRAEERLALELADRQIEHVRTEDCVFVQEGKSYGVRCSWGVKIALPGSNSLPLAFESKATIEESGDLH